MIYSMTGFGAAEGSIELSQSTAVTWRWELKSVNGRGLDIRFRFPAGFERLDAKLRPRAAALLRGSVSASLHLEIASGAGQFIIDDAALASVLDAAKLVAEKTEGATLSVDGLLAIKGVLVAADTALSDADVNALDHQLSEGFGKAVEALKASRAAEGAKMATVLSGQIDTMAACAIQARALAGDAVKVHLETLKAQIGELLSDTNIDPDRLAQEAAILATKSDIREEVDRLDGHVDAAREQLDQGGAVGRSLDFIAQEFMREANTMTVKSPTLEMKKIGLALKAVVDQFKEQVQNIA